MLKEMVKAKRLCCWLCVLCSMTVLSISVVWHRSTSSRAVKQPVYQNYYLSHRLREIEAHNNKSRPVDHNRPLNTSHLTVKSTSNHSKITAPLTNKPIPSRLIPQHWTSLLGSTHEDSYHFFSAYYDSRAHSGYQRPAILIMGYVWRTVPLADFYCLFHYQNNRTVCLDKPAVERMVTPCFGPNLAARPFHYLCEMSVGDEVPVSVQLSTSPECEPEYNTETVLPVSTRDATLEAQPPKKFGVCVSAPLVQNDQSLLQDIVEFVEMGKVMGVELFVWYVNETQVESFILDYLWRHYPDIVHTVGWRRFEKWDPLHYYGQVLTISDCHYRYMYEVDYIAIIDLDEMITPVKDNTWAGMMTSLNPSPDVASLTFQNTFFTAPSGRYGHKKEAISECPEVPLPKYFTRTQRHRCYPGFQYRMKAMHQARYLYEISVHWACGKLEFHEGWVHVDPEIAILAHYRSSLPDDDCKNSPKRTDNVAAKFREQVTKSICTTALSKHN